MVGECNYFINFLIFYLTSSWRCSKSGVFTSSSKLMMLHIHDYNKHIMNKDLTVWSVNYMGCFYFYIHYMKNYSNFLNYKIFMIWKWPKIEFKEFYKGTNKIQLILRHDIGIRNILLFQLECFYSIWPDLIFGKRRIS